MGKAVSEQIAETAAKPTDYSDRQVVRTMIVALELMHRSWFGHRFRGDANRYMPPLLVATYLWSKLGRPLSVTEAFDAMDVRHGKTGNRYIDLGVELGLLERDADASSDGRKTILRPTPLLEAEVREEAAHIADRLRDAVGALVADQPLPDTGAEVFQATSKREGVLNRYLAVEAALPKLAAAGWSSLGAAFAVLDARKP